MCHTSRVRRLLAVALAIAALAAVAPTSSLAGHGGAPTRAPSAAEGHEPQPARKARSGLPFCCCQAGARSPLSARALRAAARFPFRS
jgi:hypothetical protein